MRPPLIRDTEIFYSTALRARWPHALAREWFESYPELFEEQDLALTVTQPDKHFFEWLAAVCLFHRDGVHALVEKYGFANHPRKVRLVDELLGSRAEVVRGLYSQHGVQPPDLLVFAPDMSRYWFAEAKGPDDRVRDSQETSHRILQDSLGVDIEVIRFVPNPTPRPN